MAKNYRIVSQIIEVPGRRPFFQKCGVAFDNKDGSINLNLHMFPNVQLHVGISKVVNGDNPDTAPQEHVDEDIDF